MKNHDYLCYLTDLETLILSGCGNIQNLQFIKELPKLKHFSFVDSTIVDGNLEPCVGIDFVGFNNKRHYSHKFNELTPIFHTSVKKNRLLLACFLHFLYHSFPSLFTQSLSFPK